MPRTLLILLLFTALWRPADAQVNVWEDSPFDANATLTAYPAEGSNNAAVIVCPGGSYFWLDKENEGKKVAQWLQSNHISAFVRLYRTAKVNAFITHYRRLFRGNRFPDPQDDLRQAIKYVKAHAAELGISPNKIGVMGFSAGGHLAMSAGEFFEADCRPAFIVPIYPVVTMLSPWVHKRSRRALLGDDQQRNKQLCEFLSLERHVPDDCPPVFLVNCKDDPVVDYHNAVLLDSALTLKGIPHTYIQYATGGHGFGASETKGTEECRRWKDEFLKWFNQLIFK